jgi:parallel beta-helix repeat protein
MLILTLLLTSFLSFTLNLRSVRAATITVPVDYPSIQAAIDAAEPGDTIFVENGTYLENVVVNKKISLIGESVEKTIVDGMNNTHTIDVLADDVEIANFTVTDSGTDYPYSGIFLDNAQDSRVIDNNVSVNNGIGIFVAWGSNNTIVHNIASHNGQVGIRVDGHDSPALLENNTIEYNQLDGIFTYNAHDVIIQENTISNNGQNGIALQGTSLNITVRGNLIESNAWHGIEVVSDTSDCNILRNNVTANIQDGINVFMAYNNKISENDVMSNGWDGLYIAQCSDNTIRRNNVTDNGEGVKLEWSSGLTIIGNDLSANNGDGIRLFESSDNCISANNIDSSASEGIRLESHSNNNNITRNNVTNNLGDGIGLETYSNGNSIAANFISDSNWYGVHPDGGDGQISGTNIIGNMIVQNPGGILLTNASNGKIYHNNLIDNVFQAMLEEESTGNVWDDGYPSGGNFWSDYVDIYPDAEEIDDSGIWNTAYVIDLANQDNYPLMNQWGSVHNLDTDLRYLKIQDAISAPETLAGHAILVENGTYHENVVIDKSISLVGECKEGTIMDGLGITSTVTVTADNVLVKGFTITDSGADYPEAGVFLDHVQNSTIIDNIATNNGGHGIFVMWGGTNHILNNTATYNLESGIRVDRSPSVIANNTVQHHPYDGIFLYDADDALVENNMVSQNDHWGITSQGDNKNVTIRRNLITLNGWHGIFLALSNSSTIEENMVTSNLEMGIQLYQSKDCTVTRNNAIANQWVGIYLAWSNNTIINENNVSSNLWKGIWLHTGSNDNRIFHNNIENNVEQAAVESSSLNNKWDDGYPSGGNYWNDHAVADVYSGPYQNETGSDGIGDLPYIINAENKDNYPLVPVNFTLNLSAGWNMVSFPVIPSNTTFASIFSGAGYYQIVTWSGTSYIDAKAQSMTVGKGYWVLVLSKTTLNMTGMSVRSFELDLPAGWSMIGSIYNATVNGDTVFPPPTFYQLLTWNGFSYVDAKPVGIEPGKGYWALILTPTHITIPS